MSDSAVDRALLLPELLSLILASLEDDNLTLSSAIRANSFWNEHGIKVLWREPPSRALLHVSKHRRQIYASHVESLDFDAGLDCDAHPQYAELEFPQLRSVNIDTYRPSDTSPWIRQYLQPNLREFNFYGGNVHDDLRLLLSERCPMLKKLLIDNIGSDVPEANFVDFLRHFRELEAISLHYSDAQQVPNDWFCYLAGLGSLQSLALLNLVPTSVIRHVHETVEQPFQQLTKLDIQVQSSALSTTMSMLKGVKELEVQLFPDIDVSALSCISPLQELETLSLTFRVATNLDFEDLLALKHFPRLRELRIDGGDGLLTEIAPENWNSILKCLPRLNAIDMQIDTADNTNLLISLDQNCPRIKEIILGGPCELNRLKCLTAPLFPSLQTLTVDDFGPGAPGRAAVATAIHELHRHAPALTTLIAMIHTEFGDEVVKSWRPLWER